MNNAQTIAADGEFPSTLGSALKELEEAQNDLSTIRSGVTAASGYIDDMARAKSHIENTLKILGLMRASEGLPRRLVGGVCNDPFHPEWQGKQCQCVTCQPVGYCVEDPCCDCTGPVDGCEQPDDEDQA